MTGLRTGGAADAPVHLADVMARATRLPDGRGWVLRFVGDAGSDDCVVGPAVALRDAIADCVERLGPARVVVCSSPDTAYSAIVVSADATEVYYRTDDPGGWDSYRFDGHPPAFAGAFAERRPVLTPPVALRHRWGTGPASHSGLSVHPVFQPRHDIRADAS